MEDRFKFRYFSKRYNEMCNVDKIDFENKFLNFEYANGSIETLISTDTGILMQCTGLKDKNGKLIYEGDIVTDSHSPGKYQICWEQKYCRYFMKTNLENELYNDILDDTTDENSNHTLEVIGNIYENPDLISEVE